MDIFRWEDVHDFVEDILDKCHCGVIAGTKHIFCHAPLGPYIHLLACATKLRIGSNGGAHVPRHIYFGDYIDIAFGGIFHYFACLLLCVVATVRLAVPFAGKTTYHGLLAVATHLDKFGVFLDFDSPTLVVGEVPVEGVEVMKCHHVDKCFHLIDCIEVARHIEVCSAIAETRCIVYHTGGHLHARHIGCRERLAKCLHSVEHTCGRGTFNHDTVGTHAHAVSLFVFACKRRTQHYRLARCVHTHFNAGEFIDIFGEHIGIALHLLSLGYNCCSGVDYKWSGILAQFDTVRQGYHLVTCTFATSQKAHSAR